MPGCGTPAAAPSGARHRQGLVRVQQLTAQAALERVNLPNLAHRVGGLDVELDWPKLLSVGEQQRLAFARLLLTKPRFAILDEATSALDIPNETSLYQQLLESHTTVISVGHRSTILKFHTQILELDGSGAWRALNAGDYRFEH